MTCVQAVCTPGFVKVKAGEMRIYTALQSQKAVSADSLSEQIRPFVFARRPGRSLQLAPPPRCARRQARGGGGCVIKLCGRPPADHGVES